MKVDIQANYVLVHWLLSKCWTNMAIVSWKFPTHNRPSTNKRNCPLVHRPPIIIIIIIIIIININIYYLIVQFVLFQNQNKLNNLQLLSLHSLNCKNRLKCISVKWHYCRSKLTFMTSCCFTIIRIRNLICCEKKMKSFNKTLKSRYWD